MHSTSAQNTRWRSAAKRLVEERASRAAGPPQGQGGDARAVGLGMEARQNGEDRLVERRRQSQPKPDPDRIERSRAGDARPAASRTTASAEPRLITQLAPLRSIQAPIG